MEKKKITFETIASRIVIGIMALFLLSVIAVSIAIHSGADSLFQMDHDIETTVHEIQPDDSPFETIYKGYSNAVYAAQNTAEAYSRDLLFGRTKMVEAAVRYKNLIGWKLYAPGEYNSILYLDDGYLANANAKESEESIQKIATKIKSLKDCAEESGARFLYMQTPGNIDKYGDPGINGVKDFANQNADLLLKDLTAYGIDCLDLRENIHETYSDYHSIFYRTDHHWKHSVAVWAAGELTSFLNTKYGYSFDPSLYETARYREEILPSWYLGSLGRRATLAASEPDDFGILYPDFPVDITFRIEEKGIDKTGDFACTINYEEINDPDIYHRECYLALLSFIGCGRATVINNKAPNDTGILIVGDSLAIPETSLLALNCRQCELIDPRYFKGSIKDYIADRKPDIVINTYSTTIIQDYYAIFDFDKKEE